jgi:SAM-dependent methyltransferase
MDRTEPLFDRLLLRRRRARAAADFAEVDFLYREVAERLADRLADVRRRFPLALELGCRDGHLARALAGRGGIERLIQSDLAAASLINADQGDGPRLALDEEALPFAAGSLDLVLSCLTFHWVNDLPGALLQINHALRPDGLLLAAFFGGDTLKELRAALLEAELERHAGASPRISPFIDLRDAAGLLQRAGFALPVADLDRIEVCYSSAAKVMSDLHAMGETNALTRRPRSPLARATLARALEIYHDRFALPDGKVRASFEVIFLTGWSPAADQPKPLAPGSARHRLSDALDTPERPAGDKAGPRRNRPSD